MALLSISNLELSFGDRTILDGVNLTLDPGQHVGLVGRNGCGKSTLLKLIAGMDGLKPLSGQVQLTRGTRAGYLSQHHALDPEKTLREEAASAFDELFKLHRKLDQLTHDMATATGDALEALLNKYEQVQQQMEAAGGYAVDHRIDATLHGLGLEDKFFNVKTTDLSGGQRGRLALAKLLLEEPDLLLLDEPTNHLDIAGRQWLEEYLSSYRGAVIIISHDRWLLDRVVSKIYELDRGILEEYPGNYAKYRTLRAERLEFRRREYENQQDYIKKEQAFIDRYRAGQRAAQAQGREKRLERLKRDMMLDRPIAQDTMRLRFRPKTRSGEMVVGVDHVSKKYENKPLFSGLSCVIRRGDRIGIIGPNGAGKTTLINTLLGQIEPDTGTARLGSQVDVGYYRQGQEQLPPDDSIIEYLRRVTGFEQTARDLAGAFLFSDLDQEKKIGVLSGGERARVALASLMAAGHNLLVLDEPTNHLDIPTAERLEEALLAYTEAPAGFGDKQTGGGTLILITHDRMLLDRLVNQLLVLDGAGNIRQFYGTYHDYVAANGPIGAAPTTPPETPKPEPKPEPKRDPKPAPPTAAPPPSKKRNSKFAHLAQSKLEQQITQLEQQLADVDQQLADPDTYRDGDKVKKLQAKREKLSADLKPLEEEWLARSEG